VSLPGSTARTRVALGVLALTAGSLAAPAAYGQGYTFTFLDAPGVETAPFPSGTSATGINAAGQVVGFYNDARGARGFLYTAGTFTPIDVPGALRTDAYGINATGQVVGLYVPTGGGNIRGFLYSGGAFTLLDVPGAVLTEAYGVNAAGQVVGRYFDGTRTRGFLYDAGVYTPFDVPGADGTWALGINAAGQVVGFYSSPGSGFRGFLYDAGVYTRLDGPSTSASNFARGINAAGQIVGTSNAGFGFLYEAGVYTAINVPGARATLAFGIDDEGRIVGAYDPPGGLRRAFVATPTTAIPEPATLALTAFGTAVVAGVAGRRHRQATRG
jgi:probable HAF family extracellular repeat protein